MATKEVLGKYLGCPMDVTGHTLSIFRSIPEKISKTITSWQYNHLNQAGKLILFNSILAAFASHVMALYSIPKKILAEATSACLKFWWGSNAQKKPIYWKKRTLLEEHKHKGGMGLRNLEAINSATLFKQAWRIQNNQGLLVSKVFRAKYSDSWFGKSIRGKIPKNSSWGGRSIMKSVKQMECGIGKIIGNGKTTNILEDVWVGGRQLQFKTNLDENGRIKPVMVSDLITDDCSWDVELLKVWFEEEDVKTIKTIHLVSRDVEDEISWERSNNGEYTTKSGYWLIKGSKSKQVEALSFWKKFRDQKFWPKWKMFYWRLANGALATGVNLKKRKILSETLCPFCGKEEESDTHLFKDCEVTMRIWKSSNLGINAQNPVNMDISQWTKNWLWYLMQKGSN